MKVLVVIPAYNEAENIKAVVENLKNECPEYDYLIVNDCSKDNTENICIENGYNYISLPVNLGIGGGVQAGYKYAVRNNYDIVIQHDGDGQHDPAYMKEIVSVIAEGNADIVIGSRYITNEGFQSSAARRFGISFLSSLIRCICGAKVKDVTSGYRAVNKKFIEYYAKFYPQDYPEPEAIVSAKLNGGRIKEVPVVMRERLNGESSIKLRQSVYYMIKVSLAIILNKFTCAKIYR